MHPPSPTDNAALTVAIALAVGMLCQTIARHLRIPGIVLLLGIGVLLGPDVLGLVHPDSLGPALQIIVGFAVAVILFEGGMNLNLKRLRRERAVIQRILTIGAVVTALGASVAALVFLKWDWRLAVAFGALVIVTGPTVITPLLRRIKVNHTVETILEAEGVLIDAIGAVLAVVVLEVVTAPLADSLTEGLFNIAARLAFGVVAGFASGLLISLLLRSRKLVPDGLENVFTLTMVWALFQGSNSWMPESGVMTVTIAGLVVGNMKIRSQRHLLEFKEQLTVMFIGMLFVLLAADVRIQDVVNLGWGGVWTITALMLIVRPLNVAVSTWGSGLEWQEKAFLAWLAPRGVVAAAIASLFAQTLEGAGIEGGRALQALVFAVIASTVVFQGLSGGFVAGLLGLRRPAHLGYAILGANELARQIGSSLREMGKEVVFLDSNPEACKAAQAEGFRVIYGNVMEERTMQRAQLEARACCIAATANQEVNLLFARTAHTEFKVPFVYVAVRRDQSSMTPQVVHKAGAEILFGARRDLDLWNVRLRRKLASMETWELEQAIGDSKTENPFSEIPKPLVLPTVMQRGRDVYPVSARNRLKPKDRVDFLFFTERKEEAESWLRTHGWVPSPRRVSE